MPDTIDPVGLTFMAVLIGLPFWGATLKAIAARLSR